MPFPTTVPRRPVLAPSMGPIDAAATSSMPAFASFGTRGPAAAPRMLWMLPMACATGYIAILTATHALAGMAWLDIATEAGAAAAAGFVVAAAWTVLSEMAANGTVESTRDISVDDEFEAHDQQENYAASASERETFAGEAASPNPRKPQDEERSIDLTVAPEMIDQIGTVLANRVANGVVRLWNDAQRASRSRLLAPQHGIDDAIAAAMATAARQKLATADVIAKRETREISPRLQAALERYNVADLIHAAPTEPVLPSLQDSDLEAAVERSAFGAFEAARDELLEPFVVVEGLNDVSELDVVELLPSIDGYADPFAIEDVDAAEALASTTEMPALLTADAVADEFADSPPMRNLFDISPRARRAA